MRTTNASFIGVNPVLALQLWKNFLIKNSTNMKMMRNLITVSGTLRIEQYWQNLPPLTMNAKRLIDVIDNLTRYSYIGKLKITSRWYRSKSKATTGVKNTAWYIPLLYTTWDQMVASNIIHCVLVLVTKTITQKSSNNACLFASQSESLTYNKKLIYFSDSCGRQYKNYKNFMNLDSINTHFAKCFISVNECLIRNTETRQYSYFWLPNLHYFFLI